MSMPVSSERDTRIDVFRALALITIFIDHVPGTAFETLTYKNFGFSDAAEAFVEAKSFYDKATAKKLHDNIMSVGNSIPPDVAFRQFRGRDVDTDALMRDRGFPIPKKS